MIRDRPVPVRTLANGSLTLEKAKTIVRQREAVHYKQKSSKMAL